MIRKFANLKLFQKLSLLVAVMGIPIATLAVAYLTVTGETVRVLQAERENLDYMDQAQALLQGVALHRGLNSRIITGETASKSAQANVRQQVEATFDNLQRFDAANKNKYGLADEVTALRRDWADLTQKAWTLTVPASLEQHTAINTRVLKYMSKLGDQALILEPDLASYHLASPLVLYMPNLMELLGLCRGHGVAILNTKILSPEDRVTFTYRVGLAQGELERTRASLAVTFQQNPTYNTAISPEFTRAAGTIESFLQRVETSIVSATVISDNPKEFFAEGTAAVDSLVKATQVASGALRTGVEARLKAAQTSIYINIALIAIGVLIALFVARWIARAVTTQVNGITGLFSMIGMGDFAARAPVHGEDELGSVATALNAMLDNLLTLIQSQDEKEKLETSIQHLASDISVVAQGDLTSHANVESEVTAAIAESVNTMIDQLREVISRVHDTTLAVSSSASEVQATTEHLATGSESQAMQISDASAAIDEVAVSIQQVAANAASAAGVADSAQQIAKKGAVSVHRTIEGMGGIREQVQQTAKRIKRLGESSQEVGEIVQLISGIADRTSILALNASVQAAAAGEAGKAFAVVAEEVEALAERSAEATKKIAGLIKAIQTETTHAIAAMEETTKEVVSGSTLANEAGQRLQEIEQVSTQLAELIQSISMAAKQQTRGSDSVSKTMTDISGITQQTAAGAKQAAVSIRKLAELANDLRTSMDRFRLPASV